DIPGPDGFDTVAPLVRTGMVNPVFAETIAATFTGGFKRLHGAFRFGEYSKKNQGSHYGFIENGVVMSRMIPGLATIIIRNSGTVEMTTWTGMDKDAADPIRYARQNGLPLVDYDPVTGESFPGKYVSQPLLGNWSGSVEGKYRTLRAGAGIVDAEGDRFFLYGYFSSATASAAARTFMAFGPRYAMLTDINALEHTYLAIYRWNDAGFQVQHLIREM
ncbi:MAG TPA: hypothetical protein PLV45_08690, partial [bacterium]|nr:hypothetical protein [bacterium]